MQVKGRLSGGTGPVPTALFMTLNVGEPFPFHRYVASVPFFLVPACLMHVSVPGASPGFSGDPAVIPEERGISVSPKTTPTDTDTDLSI